MPPTRDPSVVLAEIEAALTGDLTARERKILRDRARRARIALDAERTEATRARARERAALSRARRQEGEARTEASRRLAALSRARPARDAVARVERERERIALLRILETGTTDAAERRKLRRRIREAERREGAALDAALGLDEAPPLPLPPAPPPSPARLTARLPERLDRANTATTRRRLDNPFDLVRLSWQELVDTLVEAGEAPGLCILDLDWYLTARGPAGEARWMPSAWLHLRTERGGSWLAELQRRIGAVIGPDVSAWSFDLTATEILRYADEEAEIEPTPGSRSALSPEVAAWIEDLPRPWEAIPLWPDAP